jgi:hypothetical protein
MPKNETTVEQYVEAVKLYKKLEDKAKVFFDLIANFGERLHNVYRSHKKAEAIFDELTDELSIEWLVYDDVIDGILEESSIDINYIEVPAGIKKMTGIYIINWYNDKHDHICIPLKYLMDLSEVRAIIKKYDKIIDADEKKFAAYKRDDVVGKVLEEMLEQGFNKYKRNPALIVKNFDSIGKSIFDDYWEEFAIKIEGADVRHINNKYVVSIAYTVDEGNIQVFLAEI